MPVAAPYPATLIRARDAPAPLAAVEPGQREERQTLRVHRKPTAPPAKDHRAFGFALDAATRAARFPDHLYAPANRTPHNSQNPCAADEHSEGFSRARASSQTKRHATQTPAIAHCELILAAGHCRIGDCRPQ